MKFEETSSANPTENAFEKIQQQEVIPNREESDLNAIKIQLEMTVVRRHFGFEPNNEEFGRWYSEYGDDFRSAWERLVSEEANIGEQYEEDPEVVLEKVEQKLEEVHSAH